MLTEASATQAAAGSESTGRVNLRAGTRICARCIYDEHTPAIVFDEQGICNYCRMMDGLELEYGTGTPEGAAKLAQIVEQIKQEGRGKPYDCVIGVSGGTDSSYLVWWAIENGLRPLAAHYDNTWNTAVATENIRKVLQKLGVDLYTHVVDNKEMDDIFLAFFLAGVPEIDGPTDMALAEVMYRAASKYGIRYVLEGHSFRTEGVSPLGKTYVDGRYIAGIHAKFGKLPMRTYPNMPFLTFMKWILLKRIRKIRPYWYIDYSKQQARTFLEREFGWQYYGGHHLENRMTAFNHSYYFPAKFSIDLRYNTLSAQVRSGMMTREDALAEYSTPPHLEANLLDYFRKRLGLSVAEFERVMHEPPRTYRDYPTYKSLFERLRFFFFLMYKANLVPKSFYLKYTSRSEA